MNEITILENETFENFVELAKCFSFRENIDDYCYECDLRNSSECITNKLDHAFREEDDEIRKMKVVYAMLKMIQNTDETDADACLKTIRRIKECDIDDVGTDY